MTYTPSLKRVLTILLFVSLACLGCLVIVLNFNHRLIWMVPALGILGGAMTSVIVPREERRQQGLPSNPDSPVLPDNSKKNVVSRVLIVGAGTVGRQLAEELEQTKKRTVVGFIDDHVDYLEEDRWPVLGRRHATAAIVSEYAIDEVCLAYAPSWQQELAEELTSVCPHVGIRIVPTSYEALLRLGKVQSYGDIALVSLETHTSKSTLMVKRVFDVAVSLLVLVILAPLWALVALLIRLTSKGPIIFAQERVGLHGVNFHVLKFRTMRVDAESATGPVLSEGKMDSRLTPIGRYLRLFRVDEVPQLWNILRGEMSLVGPRPERPVFVNNYMQMVPSYSRRHEVRPGMSGLAQVYGGYHTDGRDKLRFDLIYASHQSLAFDLYILYRTVAVCLFPPDDRH